ncbi:DNA repair protein RecO [Terrimonas sp. NA20]|uniref:DNA repair protein RecO n=1 Tax=Terrimonas ginsenosidimutans TaxID=2908004 RepID=A0ABS9KQ90_9BACT|nr:DNA repair protein RecO [Terrimonas ginsenosidimutans]MCG2614470.1 DNA repair protein RecO [Terrimonas ginsenosidimutans]
MPDKLHQTRGIVLRTVKYGETSVIVSMFTELFGLQSYLVNGVRASSKKGSGKANLFQPSAILDMVVYHSEMKQLQRIKEFRWGHIYQHVLTDVRRNAVAMFMIELLSKCVKQPENNPDLYFFAEDALLHLDKGSDTVSANFPLFFALHLPVFFGLRVQDNYSEDATYLDLQEGQFVEHLPMHSMILEGKGAYITSQLLKVQQPEELENIGLNHEFRRGLLQAYEKYYLLHVPDFGTLRTLPVLREVLG